jgi:hypothetical protein
MAGVKIHNKLPGTGGCLCLAIAAKSANGGFDEDGPLSWKETEKFCREISDVYSFMQHSETKRDKDTYVAFQWCFVPTREESTNANKFAVRGANVQPYAGVEGNRKGCIRGFPVLCLDALAYLLGNFENENQKTEREYDFYIHFVNGCLHPYDNLPMRFKSDLQAYPL